MLIFIRFLEAIMDHLVLFFCLENHPLQIPPIDHIRLNRFIPGPTPVLPVWIYEIHLLLRSCYCFIELFFLADRRHQVFQDRFLTLWILFLYILFRMKWDYLWVISMLAWFFWEISSMNNLQFNSNLKIGNIILVISLKAIDASF